PGAGERTGNGGDGVRIVPDADRPFDRPAKVPAGLLQRYVGVDQRAERCLEGADHPAVRPELFGGRGPTGLEPLPPEVSVASGKQVDAAGNQVEPVASLWGVGRCGDRPVDGVGPEDARFDGVIGSVGQGGDGGGKLRDAFPWKVAEPERSGP